MSYLTSEQKQVILDKITSLNYTSKTSAEITDLFNVRKMIPNPVSATTIPRVIMATEIMALLSPQSLGNVFGAGLLPHLDQMIWEQQRDRIKVWIAEFLVPQGLCTSQESTDIDNYIDATTPDPNWQSTIPGTTEWEDMFPGVEFPSPLGGVQSGLCYVGYINEARS